MTFTRYIESVIQTTWAILEEIARQICEKWNKTT